MIPVIKLGELISRSNETQVGDLHTNAVGAVTAYDAATRTASIKLASDNPILLEDGSISFKAYQILVDVPICFPSAPGGFSITWRIAVGCPVMVHYTVLDPSHWRSTGQHGPPGSVRRMAIGHAYAIPSVAFGGPHQLTPAAVDAMVIEAPEIQAGENASEFVALSNLVLERLQVIKDAFDMHTHPHALGPGTTSAPTTPMPAPSSVACTKLKAE